MPNLFDALSRHELQSALVGMVLGDVNILMHGRNARIQFEHAPSARDYVKLKKAILCQIPDLSCSVFGVTHKNPNGKVYREIKLRTTTNAFLTRLFRRVYRPTKTLDRRLLDSLTPLGLAIWYMDDGHLDLHRNAVRSKLDKYRTYGERSISARNITIGTHGFSEKENLIVCEWLAERWGIDARVKRSKGKYFYIYMNTGNARRFVDVVRQFVLAVPSMRYKIDFQYKNPKQELERFNIGHWVTPKGNLKRRT